MKSLLSIFVGLLLISAPCFADDWSSADTKREVGYLTLHSIDWMQTRYISKNPSYQEDNNLIGEHPSLSRVNNYFIATALLHIGVAYLLPSELREPFQYITIAIELGAVAHNYQIGIKLDFP